MSGAAAGELAAQSIAGSDDFFRELLEAAPDGILIVDQDGRIVLVNQHSEELFGYRRGELLNLPIEVLIPAEARERHRVHRQSYLAEPRVRPMGMNMELMAQRKDASLFPAEISLSPAQVRGRMLIIAIVRDISERRRAQQQLARQAQELARSNAELEQFAYIASHDLQEPLRMVSSYVQLLARRYRGKLDANADEFIGFAVDGVKRMQALIEDLLAYSRLTRKGPSPEETDVNAVVCDACFNLQLALRESAAKVSYDDLPTVRCDRTQFIQLFQNLIANAVKFRSQASPQIDISAQREGDCWRFIVRDNGIGIEPQYLERIFVIFQRLHSREAYPGTGMGLAICKRIVERHGGRIGVESQPGAGAAFWFTLPTGERET